VAQYFLIVRKWLIPETQWFNFFVLNSITYAGIRRGLDHAVLSQIFLTSLISKDWEVSNCHQGSSSLCPGAFF